MLKAYLVLLNLQNPILSFHVMLPDENIRIFHFLN